MKSETEERIGITLQRKDEVIEMAAAAAHEVIRAYALEVDETGSPRWHRLDESRKKGLREGVLAIWYQPDLTAAQQHNAWVEYHIREGWSYGVALDRSQKKHPCLVPWKDLPVQQRVKSMLFGATVRGVFVEQHVLHPDTAAKWLGD